MIETKLKTTVWAASLGLLLTACGGGEDAGSPQTVNTTVTPPALVTNQESNIPPSAVLCGNCGVIRSITPITIESQGTGVGAALGAIVGGLAGNQIGGGSGKKIATVAGVVGGAVAGNTIEKNRNAETAYEVAVSLENGGEQIITVPDATGISVGSSVTVENGNIYLR